MADEQPKIVSIDIRIHRVIGDDAQMDALRQRFGGETALLLGGVHAGKTVEVVQDTAEVALSTPNPNSTKTKPVSTAYVRTEGRKGTDGLAVFTIKR